MAYTIEQHEIEQAADAEHARVVALEDDVQIAGDSNRDWAVISMCGAHRFHDPQPCVIRSGLKTREAAEVARRDALLGLTDPTHRSPYGPSEVPLSYYNAVGRVMAKLKKEGVQSEDIIGLAVGIAQTAAGPDSSDDPFDRDKDGDEIPF